mmetsp:Transcript_7504/g.23912  ORF Transcript_7504/g.23912 Transcript_7504/m.23912 type:complete len:240 (+) Transcript_7504:28-747(+)
MLASVTLVALALSASSVAASEAAAGRGSVLRASRGSDARIGVADLTQVGSALQLRGGGSTLSRLLPILLGRRHCKILMLGLDSAGKTTILYQLKLGELAATTPTLGVNVETVTYKNIEFMVMDMGGQDKIRALWSHYYDGANALIFVVDSSDEERLAEAKEELRKLLGEEALKEALLLVFANKQDLPQALSVQQVADTLELSAIPHRSWYIQACSATTGAGISDGLDWLAKKLAAQERT